MLSLVYCSVYIYVLLPPQERNNAALVFPGVVRPGFLNSQKNTPITKSKDPEILISEIPGGANDVCSTNGAGFLEMFVGRPPSPFLGVFPPLEVQGWISSPKNP